MVDNKWPPNLHVDSIAMCVITESRRETSFIEAAYLIFFFFFLILWDQDGYHIFIKFENQTNKPQATDG